MGLNEMQQSETGVLRQEEKLLVDLSQPPAYLGSLQIVQTLFILLSVWAPRTWYRCFVLQEGDSILAPLREQRSLLWCVDLLWYAFAI